MTRYGIVALSVLVVTALFLAACGGGQQGTGGQQEAAPRMVVYKSPTCGCCGQWVAYMRAQGFVVETKDVNDLASVKESLGIPKSVWACHTAVVDGYVVEGHVPAEQVQRLLKERPDVAGIAVPGMPVGAPGMEVPGRPAEPFQVVAFDKSGEVEVIATYTP